MRLKKILEKRNTIHRQRGNFNFAIERSGGKDWCPGTAMTLRSAVTPAEHRNEKLHHEINKHLTPSVKSRRVGFRILYPDTHYLLASVHKTWMKSCHATTGLEPEIMLCETGQAWIAGHGLTRAESQTNSIAQNLRWQRRFPEIRWL